MERNVERKTVDVETAAAMIGIGRQLAYRLAARGELPGALRIGRRIVVSRAALEAYLKAGTAAPAAAADREAARG